MKRKLFGIAKKRKEEKAKREANRANDIARKREAIAKMKNSHEIVKSLNHYEFIKMKSDAMVHIAHNATKIALYAFPTIVLVTLTVKVTLFLINLF